MRPAIFLDRDGTIIEDRGHLKSPSEVVFFPDTVAALQRLQERFLLFIVTNQSGISQGIITPGDVERVNAHVTGRLAEEGVAIAATYVCLHTAADGCDCIKPKPHFLHRAVADHGVDLSRSFSIGDHLHDVELARNAGGRGIYLLTGHGAKHRGEVGEECIVVSGIGDAAEWILRHGNGE